MIPAAACPFSDQVENAIVGRIFNGSLSVFAGALGGMLGMASGTFIVPDFSSSASTLP